MSDSGRASHHYDRDHDDQPFRKRSRSRSHERAYNHRHHRRDDDGCSRRRSASPPRRDGHTEARRKELTVLKHLSLDAYRTDYKAGKYAYMSYQAKMAMFGSRTMPIFVPLAPGESEDQYEARFCAYLHRENRTVEQLRASSDLYKERQFRLKFATANVMGYERFDPLAASSDGSGASRPTNHESTEASRASWHSRDDGEETIPNMIAHEAADKSEPTKEVTKKDACGSRQRETNVAVSKTAAHACPSKSRNATSGLRPAALVEAHLTCGCTPCLFALMGHMEQQVDEIEEAHAIANGSTRVVDLIDEY